MIQLEIKKLGNDNIPYIEIIDFNGDYQNGFIVMTDSIKGTSLLWKPMLLFDGWEPIRKIENN